MPRILLFVAAGAALLAHGALAAEPAPPLSPEVARAAEEIAAACVARGEPAARCACGVRIAQEELDPRVFVLVPKVEPLIDAPPLVALTGLSEALDGAGLSLKDGVAAYETIRANRARVRRECAAAK